MVRNKKKNVKGLLNFKLMIRFVVVLIFLLIMLLVNYLFFFKKNGGILKFLDVLCFILFFVYILLKTKNGVQLVSFFGSSLEELRKVIWSTKRETLYTTFIVLMVTFFMSLVLWFLDSFLVYVISFILRL